MAKRVAHRFHWSPAGCRKATTSTSRPSCAAEVKPLSPIRAVAIDIDGTLVVPEQDVTPRVRRAVRAVRDRGVLVLLATGRRYDSALPFAEALELDGPMIVSGGAMVCHSATGEIYFEDALPAEVIPACVDLMRAGGLQPLLRQRFSLGHKLFTGPAEYDDGPAAIYISHETHEIVRLPYERLCSVADVMYIAGLSTDQKLLESLAPRAWDIPDVLPMVLPPGGGIPSSVLDLFNAGTTKAKALEYVSRLVGFGMDEAMAIGDGINDIDLLQAVGWPVAVGNAIPEAKAIARFVVGANDEDGVAEALERFILDS
ncbi:MAG: HAD hydrolase family protein [Chloroflexi bacterium]|nr:HAD hydrolase family protein [Chloroflexota bacterium]